MTIFIVCSFRGGPVACFDSMPRAYAFVRRQPGKFNRFEVEELELNTESNQRDDESEDGE